jgi:hypothetical protein
VDEDDLLLGLQIEAQWITVGAPAFFAASTPGAPNGQGYTAILEAPAFDPPRGLYEGDLDLTVRGATLGATLVYTTDGSLPTVDHGIVVPATEGPPTLTLRLTETALLRATSAESAARACEVATRSSATTTTRPSSAGGSMRRATAGSPAATRRPCAGLPPARRAPRVAPPRAASFPNPTCCP